MVFQVSSNCRVFMFANTLVQVSGCLPDIICIAQITLKFVDYALVVDNQRLLLFRGEDWQDFRITPYIHNAYSSLFNRRIAETNANS